MSLGEFGEFNDLNYAQTMLLMDVGAAARERLLM